MSQGREPSATEVLLIALAACVALAVTVEIVDRQWGYWGYANGAGDTPTYLSITTALRRGGPAAVHEVKHLWGVPYLAAALASASGLPDLVSLLVVSASGSVVAVLLARILWGGWTAAYFAVISWDWLQASVFGGSETVFAALVFAAFLAARREHALAAALAASLSMTVRPVGIVALGAVVCGLAWRRDTRGAASATVVGALVVIAYLMPLWLTGVDPLEHLHSYRRDWNAASPLSLPFASLVGGVRGAETIFAAVRPVPWVALVFVGVVATVVRPSVRERLARAPVEAIFFAAYVAFLCSYDSDRWAWSELPRFAIPVLPFAIHSLEPWLPHDRRILWALALASGALTAGWEIGFRHAWSLVAT